MKRILSALAALSALAFAFSAFGTAGVSAAQKTAAPPLTLELKDEVTGTGADWIEIPLGGVQVRGTHIGIKVNPVYAVDQNGNSPIWSMFRFVFTDSEGKTYDTTNFGGIDSAIPAVTSDGTATSVTWMYSYLWPKQGFCGTMYLPWALTCGGTEDKPTAAPSRLEKVRIQHNSSRATARREMLAHFFCLTDATVSASGSVRSFGDVKILEDFETETLDVSETLLYDFSEVDLGGVTWSANKAMDARFATEAEMGSIAETEAAAALTSWKGKFSFSGQLFSCTPEVADGGKTLKWEYGSYYDEYDPALNSYGSLGIPLTGDEADFSGAKGLTLWMKNPQPYPVSFNLEFAETEEGGPERWNLNGTSQRTLYFYDTQTGEEFSAPTLNVAFIPANFCGWIRIPFSMYAVPDWSMALPYTDGVYDEAKPHTNIYITSQFVLNDGVTMYFDNIGLYYNDFSVGRLFTEGAPSIRACMEAAQ